MAHFGGNLFHLGGRGAGTRRVDESEGRGVFGFRDQGKGILEFFLGLAREADDDVGRDGESRDDRTDFP